MTVLTRTAGFQRGRRVLGLLLALCLTAGILAPGAVEAAALPAFSLSGSETVDQMMKRLNAATPDFRAGYLTTGQPATAANVEAMVRKAASDFGAGKTWNSGPKYSYTASEVWRYHYGSWSGSFSFAFAMLDYLFGEDGPVTKHTDFDKVKTGDAVWVRDQPVNSRGYAVVVVSGPDSRGYYQVVNAGEDGKVQAPHALQLGHSRGSSWSDSFYQYSMVFSRYDSAGKDPETPEEPSFPDVKPGSWAYPYVERAVKEGWVDGLPDGTFNPEGVIHYSEFAKLLAAALVPRTAAGEKTDRPWYARYVNAASLWGLWAGTAMAETGSDVDREVSRYEMAQFLYNAAGRSLKCEVPSAAECRNAGAKIPDWADIPERYRTAVGGCTLLGLLSGVDSRGTFSGAGTVTREQAAKLICSVSDIIGCLETGV